MDGLSEEDRYDFDVMGWLRVPAVLGDAQIHNLVSSELSTYQHVGTVCVFYHYHLCGNLSHVDLGRQNNTLITLHSNWPLIWNVQPIPQPVARQQCLRL